MYKDLKDRLTNALKQEFDYVSKFERDEMVKADKMLQIKNMLILLTGYEKIEPDIAKAINNLAQKSKWKKEDR